MLNTAEQERHLYEPELLTTKSDAMKRLSEISPGKKVVIRAFEEGDLFIKLMEMGCVPGETVVVEQVAPLGDPISISVAGYRLSLRLNEAYHILVEEDAG